MTHDKPSKKVGAQVSEPREFWVSYEGMPFRKASEYYVETSETNDCIHVIEKSAYDKLKAENQIMRETISTADDFISRFYNYDDVARWKQCLAKLKGGAK